MLITKETFNVNYRLELISFSVRLHKVVGAMNESRDDVRAFHAIMTLNYKRSAVLTSTAI